MGLEKKESALLDVLYRGGPQNTSALAYEARLPRVTAMRFLKKLRARGFVSRQTLKREVCWSLMRPELILRRAERIFANTPAFAAKDILHLSEIGSVTVFRGPEEMLESNQKFLVAHPGERLYSIEPNGIWKYFAKVPVKEWVHLNSLIKQKNIIVETLIESGFQEVLGEHIDKSLEESFLSLIHEVWVLPRGTLDSATELLIFRDEAFFYDWSQFVCVSVKNPSSVRLLKGMFQLLKETAEPYRHSR